MRQPGGRSMASRFQRNVLTGLLTVVPLWVTWIVFEFVLELLARFGSPAANWLARQFDTEGSVVSAWLLDPWFQWTLAIVITILGLYFLGLAASFVIGRKIINWVDSTLERLPFVKKVYGATKRLVEVMNVRPDQSQRVALIEFPMPGMKAVGLVTRTMTDRETGEQLAAVFVPTTPNPTSGYLEILPMSKVLLTDLSFDEAMSFVITGGAVGPDRILFSGKERRDSPSPAPAEPVWTSRERH
jgi:uncharacterized membrane protein